MSVIVLSFSMKKWIYRTVFTILLSFIAKYFTKVLWQVKVHNVEVEWKGQCSPTQILIAEYMNIIHI